MSNIAFIGGGNMAAAIIGGLIASGRPPGSIMVVEPSAEQRAALAASHGVTTSAEIAAAQTAETLVIAVKPQIIPAVAKQAKAALDLTGKLLISIAAGTTIARLEALFGAGAIVRTMPNTPALLGLGATGLFANGQVSEAQRATARGIVEAFGICIPVAEESLLDAVTAVSGSGPAYIFLLIEEMTKSGMALGLGEAEAGALAIQTALGAASMAAEGTTPPAELRRRVTSPNGTTHAAIVAFQEQHFGQVVETAMTACRDRAVELGKE